MPGYFDLTGKVALVTGGSSGIGAATAVVFAELGASVALSYHRNPQGAGSTCDRIREAGGTAVAIQADVRRVGDVRAMVERAATDLGPIDILVNNAGSLVARMAFDAVTEETWDDIYALNVKSVMLVTQAVAPAMVARRQGSIVNVGSIAGHHGGGPGAAAYASAKAAVMAYTKGLARELASTGVRVNGVAPGVIETPFHERFSTPEMMRAFTASIPLGRVGTPTECATVIAFLASDAASYLIGETIEINGGQLML
jgi:NAD(P)-dependent dehydrogenase (short-subunit alcohol dehydrogenase family)